jgi:hypothetical protein
MRTNLHASRLVIPSLLALGLAACHGEFDAPEPEDYADDPEADLGEEPLERRQRPDLAPGMMVRQGTLEVPVPAPGEGVFAEALRDDGTSEVVTLETDEGGVVWELEPRVALDEPPEGELVPLALRACSDGAHSLLPWRWNRTFQWRFYAASTPSYLSRDAVERALRRATSNITRSRNTCGLADRVSATHRYLGRSTSPVSRTGPCGGRDGINNVGFGRLDRGVLAVTCTFSSGGVALESDLRFNRAYRWFLGAPPAGCSGAYSLAGVATHERGHTFGLGHASPQHRHAALTMSPAIGPCDSSAATLGLGDVRGLRKKY